MVPTPTFSQQVLYPQIVVSEQDEVIVLEKRGVVKERGVLERWEAGKDQNRKKRSDELYNDPMWRDQWFLVSQSISPR